ncbi:MAG: hypothetical protein Q8N47_13815 [Bryobacterales bacterium]|nr:hypothetical protein [Bryobacterales bacterium]
MKQLFLSPVLALALVTLTGCEPTESTKSTGAAQAAPVAQNAIPRPSPAPEIVIPRGTAIRARLSHAVSTEANRPGDPFTATLDEPLVIDGRTVLPRGIGLRGTIRESDDSGRLTGRAVLALNLESVAWNGRTYALRTETHRSVSASHKKRNAVLVGGGSGLGALLGGIAGGGRGALIGAGAGAAAGTAGAAATGKREIRIPAESVLGFRLREPLSIKG